MTDPVRVPVVRVDAELPLPAYARADDAGLDLHAAETVTLVVPRSGLALRHGVTVLNTPGLIDAGYRGEVKVLLVNHGQAPVTLNRGDRVAQLVVHRVERVALVLVTELPDSPRGSGGFGSTGG